MAPMRPGMMLLLLLVSHTLFAYDMDGDSCYCYDCRDCNEALDYRDCQYIYLADSISYDGTCISPSEASGKRFDCQEYSIIGSGTGTGVEVGKGNDFLTVANCTVSNFEHGFTLDSCEGVSFINDWSHHNLGYGFYSESGSSLTYSGCTAGDNRGYGFTIRFGQGLSINNCISQGNWGAGFMISEGSNALLSGNLAQTIWSFNNRGYGFRADNYNNATLINNTAIDIGGTGISLADCRDIQASRNRADLSYYQGFEVGGSTTGNMTNNSATGNQNGFNIYEGELYLFSHNRAYNNTVNGIQVERSATIGFFDYNFAGANGQNGMRHLDGRPFRNAVGNHMCSNREYDILEEGHSPDYFNDTTCDVAKGWDCEHPCSSTVNVSLIEPKNRANLDCSETLFSWTVEGPFGSPFICTMFIDSESEYEGEVWNRDVAYIQLQGIESGSHTWYVYCIDEFGNYGQSASRTFSLCASSSGGSCSCPTCEICDSCTCQNTTIYVNSTCPTCNQTQNMTCPETEECDECSECPEQNCPTCEICESCNPCNCPPQNQCKECEKCEPAQTQNGLVAPLGLGFLALLAALLYLLFGLKRAMVVPMGMLALGKPSDLFLYSKGAPLSGAKMKVREPDGTMLSLLTDKDGHASFVPSKKGQYSLSVDGYSVEGKNKLEV